MFGRFWTFPAYDVSLGALLGCRIASPRLSRHNSAACIIGLMALSFHHFSPSPTVWRARWWVASAMACQPLDVGERPAVQLPGPDVLGVHFTGDLPAILSLALAQSPAVGNSSQMGSFGNLETLGAFTIITRKKYALYCFLVHVRAACRTCHRTNC